MPEDHIDIQEAVQALRDQLSAATARGKGQDVRFRVGPVELEFLVEVSRQGGAEGQVKFFIVSLAAHGTVSKSITHRIKLTLQPMTDEGEDIDLADTTGRPE